LLYLCHVILLWLLASPALAAQFDAQTWFNITDNQAFKYHETPSSYRYWLEWQPRFGDNLHHLSQTLLRTGLGYSLDKNTSLWLGFAWIDTSYPFATPDFQENRLWQQLLWSHHFNQNIFTLRARLEERFFQSPSPVGYRIRALTKLAIPLNSSGRCSYIINNELFWQPQGFNQNRLFLGVGYRYNDAFTLELGYLNQFIKKSNAPNFIAHILSVQLLLAL